jgi:hypothetical protein
MVRSRYNYGPDRRSWPSKTQVTGSSSKCRRAWSQPRNPWRGHLLLGSGQTTIVGTIIVGTITDPARYVYLRCTGRDTVHAFARGGNWSRRIDFLAQHFGWAAETGRSRFETACEYYLCRKEGRFLCLRGITAFRRKTGIVEWDSMVLSPSI